ncbi:hypothetical protein JL720_3156 [Aureococcus anophagefferens]|nr:hypothetical protein JL720_3156 [Aureococcus anophagefferens]
MLLYDYTDHAGFEATIEKYDALIVRINPGQLSQIPGVDGVQAKFDATMNAFVGKGKPVWSSPGVQQKMGAKDALCKIANMGCGLVDTFAYYGRRPSRPIPVEDVRGVAGDDVMLKLMEMNDNHVEYHTVKEFLVFCVDGPSGAGAGTWTSTFPGEYLKGGARGGQLVDQRLLPRISEGEVRVLMAGDTCQMIIHKKPEGGLSAVGGNSAYTYYEPSDPLYADLLTKLTTDIKNGLMDVLDLKGEALPLLWTCDYIPKNPEGWSKTENACDMETEYVVGEFNCSCVGVSMFQAVCGGDKTLADVPDADYYEACKLTDLMGIKREMLDTAAASKVRYNTLLPSPAGAKYSLAVVQFKVPGHPNGGSDKGPDGNRIDSIPIANGVIKAGGACDMLLYDYTDHAGFEATIEKYDALIVRINPGQLSQIPGVDGVQAKFDATMNAFVGKGKPVWSSPGVQQKMGAKDALCKIANMGCGLVDTFAYYDGDPRDPRRRRRHLDVDVPGEYLKGGAAAASSSTSGLPRISEGEVRVLMAGDTCQMIIHKKPEGGLSALTTDIKNGLMDVLDLKGEALPLLWTCDYIPKNPEGWSKTENARDMETEYVAGEFNCSCVGVSMFQAVCGGDKTLADVPDADYYEACKLTDLMGIKALEMLDTAAASRSATTRCCRRRRAPRPGRNRIDSIPIANGVIKAGGACDMLLYDYTDHAGFEATIEKYDALIVRINPGQLSQIPGVDGVQAKFDATMNAFVGKGKPVWSSPGVQQKMGAKDALCKIANMGCGLFKKTMAFQPRVVKQNRGSAGEGIWLCWIANETKDGIIPDIEYPSKTFGAESLGDDVMLKLMEMNDNHVEYHTVKEFLVFCVDGPSGAGAGTWTSTFPGEYLKGGAAAGGQLVDQRLLPRISEGEVRVLMAGDTCQMIIHKKPEGGLSAVGGNSAYTYYEPSDPLYADLLTKLTTDIKNGLMDVLDLKGEALPLLWTCDYIPKNPEGWSKTENARDMETEYVVGEFNCSCVGVSMFQAVCGGDKTLADVPDADYYEACKLTDLMGIKALEMLDTAAASKVRYNTLLPSPAGKYSLAVVQFKAGGACDMLLYDYTDHAGFEATIEKYDALIVRINPGQLSQIPGVDGVQAKFDATMNAFVGKGKPVWSSPGVQQKMGAKDALCKIANMGCGLFKKTMAFQPRVVKQNRGSAGEGIWLCWIANETKDGIIPDIEYPSKTFGPSRSATTSCSSSWR